MCVSMYVCILVALIFCQASQDVPTFHSVNIVWSGLLAIAFTSSCALHTCRDSVTRKL